MSDDARVSIREIEWGEPLLQQVRIPELEAIGRKGGPVLPALSYYSAVPWVFLGCVRFNQRLLSRVALEHDLADLIGLVVSRDNSCRYCFAVQRALLLAVGVSEERIVALEDSLAVSGVAPEERAALDLARRLSRSNPLLSAADLEPLHAAGFDSLAIREIAIQAALNVFFNRISTLGALPTETWEAMPERWYARLVRPFFRRGAERLRRRADATRLADEQREGPFAPLVNALDGHPFAGELRITLDDTLAESALSRRAKALCFAVVGRALGCPLSESEARRIATAEGLAEADFDEALRNLASPALDPLEAQLLPFSRQTVWYQVPDMQRRSRELAAELSPEAFLETLMVVSVANLVCRLGFLAHVD